jgi:hypothetical protein
MNFEKEGGLSLIYFPFMSGFNYLSFIINDLAASSGPTSLDADKDKQWGFLASPDFLANVCLSVFVRRASPAGAIDTSEEGKYQ